jgi:hypothetical protein
VQLLLLEGAEWESALRRREKPLLKSRNLWGIRSCSSLKLFRHRAREVSLLCLKPFRHRARELGSRKRRIGRKRNGCGEIKLWHRNDRAEMCWNRKRSDTAVQMSSDVSESSRKKKFLGVAQFPGNQLPPKPQSRVLRGMYMCIFHSSKKH